jgi:hypothetical protein
MACTDSNADTTLKFASMEDSVMNLTETVSIFGFKFVRKLNATYINDVDSRFITSQWIGRSDYKWRISFKRPKYANRQEGSVLSLTLL